MGGRIAESCYLREAPAGRALGGSTGRAFGVCLPEHGFSVKVLQDVTLKTSGGLYAIFTHRPQEPRS